MRTLVDLAIPSIAFLLVVAVGLDLTRDDFHRVRRQPLLVATGIVAPLVVLPVMSLLLVRAFDPPPATVAGLLLIAACPIGGVSNAYSYLAGASPALSVTLTACSCVVSVVTIPALTRLFEAALGQPLGFAAPPGALALQLFVMLALPVGIGMAVRRHWPDAAQRHRRLVQAAGFAALAGLVALVVWNQFDAFRRGVASTVPLAAAFVAGAFGIGWALGRLSAPDRRDRFTLAVEFATRNVSVATAIAVTILGRVDFAVFATTYLLTELPLALAAITVFRRGTASGGNSRQ